MKRIFTAFLLTACLAANIKAQSVYSIGPMLHYNFGGSSENNFSFGIEAAYWNAYTFPYGFDIGIEWEKSKTRLYTEAQTGIIFGGISAGPYIEFSSEDSPAFGLQSSVWANAFIGVDLRARFNRDGMRIAPGLYGKILFTPGNSLWEEWEEHHPSDGDDDWD